MKRLLAILLLIVMVCSVLVACGNDSGSGKTPVNPGPSLDDDDGDDDDGDDNWWDDLSFDTGTTITIQFNSADDNELPSGCDSYMKGPDTQINTDSTTSFEKVQNAVFLRNKTCSSATRGLGLSTKYVYIDKVWGSVKSAIVNNENAYGANESVDLYCDLQYDMFGAACENAVFANALYYTTTAGNGYMDIQKQNGYFVNYMEDNALSSTRQCIIASDYFMDVLRAMIILPFNMNLYKSKAVTTDTDCSQFYQMILDGDWTWDKLMTYSNVFDGSGAATKTDTLLLTLVNGGISCNAFLYGSTYDTFTYDATNGYQFKSTCSELQQAFLKAKDVAESVGVLTNDDLGKNDITIANQLFTSGNVLFGTPNILGIIETEEFQEMQGLSIAPIPKLNTNLDYSTVISSRARVGAMSYNSTKKVATSAFIQFQTESSGEVKEEYFSKAMNGKYLAGSGAGEILSLIYDSISSNKSSTLDNLTRCQDWSVNDYVWTVYLGSDGFGGTATSFTTFYNSAVDAKNAVLDTVLQSWNSCLD